jgi:superfamily II DNA/RNA helicase
MSKNYLCSMPRLDMVPVVCIKSFLFNIFLFKAECWPIIASGRDMIGIAETGSGKTLAFTIPALAHLTHRIKVPPPS